MPGYSGGASTAPKYKPKPLTSGGGSLSMPSPGPSSAGRFSLDLTNLPASAGESLGSLADFGGGIVGGIAGAIGSIGPDGETASIGQLFEDVGRIPGGVGDIELPYLGNDPNANPARLSEIPGKMLDVVTAPGRALERTFAGQRVEAAQRGEDVDLRNFLRGSPTPLGLLAGEDADNRGLPPDLQARLDAGDSVDTIADELVARGAGFSGGGITNTAAQILLDPLNLIAPGASKAAGAVRGAGVAVRAADDLASLGIAQRSIGRAYNAAARGMNEAGARLVDVTLGPTTSGVIHALGTAPYRNIRSGLGNLSPAWRDAFEDAFARGAAQMPRAVIGHYMADEASALVRRFGEAVADRLPDVGETVARRLQTVRQVGRDDLERRTQELMQRVAPSFDGIAPAALADITARKLAAITGSSVEDASAILGSSVDRQTAQTVHLAYYGKAGDDLARAKAGVVGKSNIDSQRLTLVNDDTLTVERADELLSDNADLVAAVERYPVLANRFEGKAWTPDQVREFVQRLKSQDALITTVKRPKTGKNALPPALAAWRGQYLDKGYDLGFAPKGGWRVVTDADGVPVYADPFVHFTSEADPVGVANPLGRFVDSLFRGVTQTTIIGESRVRFVDEITGRGLPIAPNQARAIHKAILEEAADRGVTPRSLVADSELVRKGDGTTVRTGVIDAVFARFLTPDEFRVVKDQIDPVFLTMRAFQGNLRTVGLSQYITGGVKRAPGLGPVAATVAERIYPSVRFALNPLFQLQELLESRILNALRGVTSRELPADVAKVYGEMTQLPELRYLAEAGYFLNLASGDAVRRFVGANTPVGRALGRFADVQGQKSTARVAQVLSQHGEAFKAAVEKINPRAWKTMQEAYGTTDPRIIADRYMVERFAIGPGENLDDALAAFDASRTLSRTTADETIWQAFRTTFEQASREAFTTHYFNPQRGWLERSLNHPYLGIYPLSYMWGKVLPEFARFLVRRPFGLDAPLVGAAGLEKVQQATLAALADDAEFRGYIQDHPDALYLIFQLLPGDPTNLGAGAPAWARHLSADARAGKPITVETLGREATDTAGYAFGAVRGPVTIATGAADLAALGAEVFANLDLAARQYDGMIPTE